MNHRLDIDPNREWKFQLTWICQAPVERGQETNIYQCFQVQRVFLGVSPSFVSEEEREVIYWATKMALPLKARLTTKKTTELVYWDQFWAGFGLTCFYVLSHLILLTHNSVVSLGDLHYRWKVTYPASHYVCVKAKILTQVSLSPEPMANHPLKWLHLKVGISVELVEHLHGAHSAEVGSPAPQEEKTVLSGNWREWEPMESSYFFILHC